MEVNGRINVVEIVEELRAEISKRNYSSEALDFIDLIHADDVKPFSIDGFQEHIEGIQQSCCLNYDIPISGKGKLIKKIIKKMYRFHLKPLVDQQNEINANMILLLAEVRNYIVQAENSAIQNEQIIEQLKRDLNKRGPKEEES